jgi:hypothetical protein
LTQKKTKIDLEMKVYRSNEDINAMPEKFVVKCTEMRHVLDPVRMVKISAEFILYHPIAENYATIDCIFKDEKGGIH